MKKVMITGSDGFIGRSLIKQLNERSISIIAIIRSEECISKFEGLEIYKFVVCDLNDIDSLPNLLSDRDIDVCIHLAWDGVNGNARADYDIQLLNVKFSMDLINSLSEIGVKRFVGAGTLAEKDVEKYHAIDGSTPNPVSIYGISKLTAHYMTKVQCSKMGIEHIWCLLSNTYGVGNTTNNFINMASKKIINREHAAFTDGEQLYDFVYITDTVNAIIAVAESGKTNSCYYLGSSKSRKLKEYIMTIRDTVDPSIGLFLGEIPYKGVSLTSNEYDTKKLSEDTGFMCKVDFEEGIKRTIDWLEGEKNGTKI